MKKKYEEISLIDQHTKQQLKALREEAVLYYSKCGFTIEELAQAFNKTLTSTESLLGKQGHHSPLLVTPEIREQHWQRVERIRWEFTQKAHSLGCDDDMIDYLLGRDPAGERAELKVLNNKLKAENAELKASLKIMSSKHETIKSELIKLKIQYSL